MTNGEATPTCSVSRLGVLRPVREKPNHVLGQHQQPHQTRFDLCSIVDLKYCKCGLKNYIAKIFLVDITCVK